MLIFDGFASMRDAIRFAETCGGTVCLNQDESDELDPFPYALVPPIVLTARRNEPSEKRLALDVIRYGGRFAGT